MHRSSRNVAMGGLVKGIVIAWPHFLSFRFFYLAQSYDFNLVQAMGCRLFGAKPLPEPMLPYCRLNPQEQTLVRIHQNTNKQRFLTPGHQGWNDLHSLCRIGMECYLLNDDDNNIIYWIMMIIMIMMMMIIIMIIMMTMMIIGTATIMIMIIIITTTLTMTIMKMIMIKTAQTPCQSLYKDRRI